MKGLITNIQRFSIHDGPGIRTTVFFKGCSLSCAWCQNPEAMSDRSEIIHFASNCIACKKCIEICPGRCFSYETSVEFNSDGCDQCGLCIENCPVGALKWSSMQMSSDDVLKEVMRDKPYYDVSGGGITLSGGEPLNQIDFCHDIVSKSKALGLHVAIDTSGCADADAFDRIIPFVDLFLYDIKFIDDNIMTQ